ncbi:hypothetical protein BS47DRAFT_1369015 [Hydnum rufescens UP504]|uniref:Uncharacterized protein n=1 Tax=Hydnum rufescens UP504 TaxID=1448309 RepID=A0A9P6AFT0_9AGAM|nr:hypothetical protein BS47DRAFT_1369015 [Hydnum rufescens UP504]
MPINQSMGGNLSSWNSRDTPTSMGCRTENARDEQLSGHSTIQEPEELHYSMINEKLPNNELEGDHILEKLTSMIPKLYLINTQGKADLGGHQDLDRIDEQQIVEAADDVRSCIQSKKTQAVVRTIEEHAELQPYNASNPTELPNSSGREDCRLGYSHATDMTESTNQAPIVSTTDYRMKDMQYDTSRLPDNVLVTQVMIEEAYYHANKPTGAQYCIQSKELNDLIPQDQSKAIAGTVNRPKYASNEQSTECSIIQEPEELCYSMIDAEPPDNELKGAHVLEELASTIFESYLISVQLKVGSGNHRNRDILDEQRIVEVANGSLDIKSCLKFKEISRSRWKGTWAMIRTVKQQIEIQPYVGGLTELPSSSGAREGKSHHSCETVGTSPNLKRSPKVIDMTNCQVKGGQYVTLDSFNSISGSRAMQWDLHYLDNESEEQWHVIEVTNKSLGIEPCVGFKEVSRYVLKPNLKDDLKLGVTVRMAEQQMKAQYYTTNNPRDPTGSSHCSKQRPKLHCSSIANLSLRPNNWDLGRVLGTVSLTGYQVRTEESTLEPSDKDSVTWKSQNGASYHPNNEKGKIDTNSSEYESNNRNPIKTNNEFATNGITGLNHLETPVEGVISDKGFSEEDVSMSEIKVEVLLGPYPESLQDELMLKSPKPHLQVESSNSSIAKKESGPLAGNTHNTKVKPERSERSYLRQHVTASQKKSESNKVAAL